MEVRALLFPGALDGDDPAADIEIDGAGRPHVAFVLGEGLIEVTIPPAIGISSSSPGRRRLTDERNISLAGWCGSLSLRLDEDGHEHLLYWCMVPSATLDQPVILGRMERYRPLLNRITDGTGQCELHLDDDGERAFHIHARGRLPLRRFLW
jgi:hypothetical protein